LNRVATLTLNTSRNLNALSLTMIEATSITDGARR
jgi:enoyl-CoA hydratase/carnithine racemase